MESVSQALSPLRRRRQGPSGRPGTAPRPRGGCAGEYRSAGSHRSVTIWNHAAEQLFGCQASEIIGWPSPLASAHRPCPEATLAGRVLDGEVLSAIETSLLCKDGLFDGTQ